jgi:hypothetical protein
LSRQTEQSEEHSMLPPPELNPLLNPLLAENMGRWAQTYFTSPPEKREQAVHELLRELEAEKSGRAEAEVAASTLIKEQRPEPAVSPATQPSDAQPTLVRCHACGRKNLSSQKFCGMCGTHLGEDGEVAELHRDHLHSEDLVIADLPNDDEPAVFAEDRESHFVPRERDIYETRLNTNELSLFQSGSDINYDDDDVILSTPPGGGGYRIVIGFVLAIVIGTLAFMAWRSAQQTSQSQLELAAPPVASSEAAPSEPAPAPSSPPVAAKTNTSDGTPPAENQATRPTASPAKDAAKPASNESTAKADNTAPTLPHGVSRPPKAPPTEASAGKGGEELAVAQGYLNGTNGQGRNSAEAAKWLWKAIAKHNAEASLLLSDLYLKGEGVSKNCDQARVLLDSAALQGVKDAGMRLRHLQAFGCQ